MAFRGNGRRWADGMGRNGTSGNGMGSDDDKTKGLKVGKYE